MCATAGAIREGALKHLDASTGYFEELGNKAMACSNRLWQCLWLCGAQPPSGLLAGARRALQDLTARPSRYCLREISHSVFGAIAREAGEYELAEKSLTKAVQRSRAKGAKQVLCGSLLHLAQLRFDTGDQAGGEDYLRQALDLAAANGYVMFWDLHLPTLAAVAARCVKSGIHAGHAQKLVARYFGAEAAEFLSKNAVLTADDRLRELAAAFISRYGKGPRPEQAAGGSDEPRAPKISVCLLGKFNIAVNGVVIPEQEWKTKKIAGILKYLLAYRGQAVSGTG